MKTEDVDFRIGSNVARMAWTGVALGTFVLNLIGFLGGTIERDEIYGIVIFFGYFLYITRQFLHGETMMLGTFDLEPHQKRLRCFFLASSVLFFLFGVDDVFD